ncbi:MAG: type II toxin-antitoxin system HicA family toxin [Clostridium sp.]|jgi:mRNA interferase HicA|uniref:type II toxin-antitoxin system HicA family toxin n=1 Tax=Clostridium sp. TaxID=1506 RepID=UPI0025B87986|nr:type II toxin-antitoxin system HicA family toxin [Clostridium sp.]MCH3965273.1 type II toxin-antitoxin system HicA family toxin [Clostridium sp.]MCI1714494.1 type II toxin-antitoxin system HicA family toxin [Clostridium sp.]MCI1798756.1 type II toxin-antitoxin system HicA family toxin [Clostridium sp.]MCI1812513.1 type II toxin-antitoxin system HicA family toxin [Clostridium sp.]MCI1869566.1 type II toxin-antitoxin system HicA family toxin [Clostridium sp.]
MNSKEIVEIAQSKGWEVKTQRGSHIKLVHKNFPKPVIIPYHGTKEIPRGTLNSILRRLGLK